jgi:tetratricopeptide (TPR) repeat protein
MSIEILLDLIRNNYSPSEGQIIVKSLQQDPLVWQFARDHQKSLDYFEIAGNDISAFTPGRMSLWLIEKFTGDHLDGFGEKEFHLPDAVKEQGAQALKTVLISGLPPSDLLTAGLVAMILHERRMVKGSWEGLADEIFIKTNQKSDQKNFFVWRTPFACLTTFCTDFDDIFLDFMKSKSPQHIKNVIPIFIHAFLANPTIAPHLLDRLYSFTNNLPLDSQLDVLKWVKFFQQPELCETLAKKLFQSKNNINSFAEIFSEIESFETTSDEIDPLNRQIRYTLPEDLNRLSAFYYYCGNSQKSAEMYQKSSDLLEFIKAQTLFQSNACHPENISQSNWLNIIKSVPNSKQARFLHILSLIQENKLDEASRYLSELPASSNKYLLDFQIQSSLGKTQNFSMDAYEKQKRYPFENLPPRADFYITNANVDLAKEFLKTASRMEEVENGLPLVESYLEDNFKNPEVVSLTRIVYEKAKLYSKAIELTSYLDRLEPENHVHKSDLARLYGKAERWSEAFTTLQSLIKSQSTPDINDLERFAEAALRTDHVDMSISICQNILQQKAENTQSLILLGEAYMLKGDVVKAIQHMEQVVEMIPDQAETWLALARLWRKAGHSDRAFEILQKGVIALPNNPELLRTLGKAHLEKQAPSDALICLKKAFEYEPTNLEGKIDLAQAEFELGKYHESLTLLEPYLECYKDKPRISRLLGHVLLALGKKDKAEAILLSAAEHDPDDQQTLLAATRTSLERLESSPQDDSEELLIRIRKLLQKSLLKSQDRYAINLHLADIERLLGFNQKAFDLYTKLAKEDAPQRLLSDWRLDYGMGQAAMALGNFDVGLASLKQAVSKKSESLLLLHALAEAYQVADLSGKAKDTARSALKLAPQDFQNILWYANFKTRNNEPEEAVKALKEALQIDPNRSELKLWLARSLVTAGSMQEAHEILRDLIQNSVSEPEVLQQACYVSIHLNDLNLAVDALNKANVRMAHSNPTLLMDMAIIYSLMKQPKSALESLNCDQEMMEKYPQLLLLKADVLCILGQFDAAHRLLTNIEKASENALETQAQALGQSPLLYTHDFSKKGYYYRLGQVSRATGRITAAQSYLVKALLIDPDDIKVRNAVVEAFMVGLNFNEAMKYAMQKEHLRSEGDSLAQNLVDMSCTAAEILFAEGKKEQAEDFLSNFNLLELAYPRYLAIRSIVATDDCEPDLAKKYFNEAIQSYQDHYEVVEAPTLEDVFRQTASLSSIALAAHYLNNELLATQFHQKSNDKLNNQPLFILRYAQTLLTGAENQGIADTLSILNHAPGQDFLSQTNKNLFEDLIAGLNDFLPPEQLMCLKARGIAAYTGTWPLSLNADSCLVGPNEASAILLSSEDSQLAKKIIAAYPENHIVLQAYGIHQLRNNRNDGATYVEKALGFEPCNPINHALLALLNRDDPETAVKSLETALEFWPDEPGWHAMAADLYTQIGHTLAASHHIDLALDAQPQEAKFWQKSAEIKLQRNDFIQAKQDFEKSASLQSSNSEIYLRIADVNRKMGDINEVINNIQKASELDPNNLEIAMEELQFFYDQNRFIEAENKAVEIIKKYGDNHQVLILSAKSQANQGKFASSLETLTTAINKDPDNADLTLERLKILKDKDGVEDTLPELISLAQDNPQNASVLTTLTDWLIQTNRLEEAKETAQTILKIFPEQPEVHLMLGRLQRKNGQLDQAIAHLSDAITFNPNLVEAYIELGKVYQERRDLESAINLFQQGVQANASDPRPYFYAAMALKECKDYKNAEAMLKQAKRYSPDDANIIRQLGVVTALNLVNNLRETR